MNLVRIRCQNGHEHEIYFDDPHYPECDHDKSDKVRGRCIQCAMQSVRPDPDPRCPTCGSLPARIVEQPPVRIKILKG